MSDIKKLASYLYLKNSQAVKGFDDQTLLADGDAVRLAVEYSNAGADELILFDLSVEDQEHEENLLTIKEIGRKTDLFLRGGGNIKRIEDVKKLLYAGCRSVFLDLSKETQSALLEGAAKRFGREKIAGCANQARQLASQRQALEEFASEILIFADEIAVESLPGLTSLPIIALVKRADQEGVLNLLSMPHVAAVGSGLFAADRDSIMRIKNLAAEQQIKVNRFESSMSWKEFKLNSDKMLPVIVQDYQTLEVLMMAYMNQEAFETTVRTGKMTYFSRSRNALWIKGETSGHYQYVKVLSIDCDNDTLLAKVAQIGAACHTGNRSCFYRDIMKKEYDTANPLSVLEETFAVIRDRKEHPKEGSYTNYLFDKGIDKILKKVGEEAAEIIIAAKNPNPEEIKYEISDFLYHVMVLMADKGISWEDITRELAQR